MWDPPSPILHTQKAIENSNDHKSAPLCPSHQFRRDEHCREPTPNNISSRQTKEELRNLRKTSLAVGSQPSEVASSSE